METQQQGFLPEFNRFSVVIPAYNAAAYIREALQSIAKARGLELLDYIVVVDDASTDSTAACARHALAEFNLPGILVQNPTNLGVGQSRRIGFAQVHSPLIACVDADDCCEENRFIDPLHVLQKTEVMLVGGDVQLWADACSPPADLAMGEMDGSQVRMPTSGDAIAAALLFYCPIYAGVSMFRRELLALVSAPSVAIGEDWLMAHQVVQTFGSKAVANTGTMLARYRRHAGQLTCASSLDSSSVFPLWRKILMQTLGLDTSADELALHAKFSPLGFKKMPVPTQREWQHWQTWATRMQEAATEKNYFASAVALQIQQVTALLQHAMHETNRRLQTQAPDVVGCELAF